jgi:tetratricopeptide (TPR) repeat protein
MIGNIMVSTSMPRRFSWALIAVALIWAIAVPACVAENLTSMDWFARGYDLYNLGRYNESLEAYTRSLDLNGTDEEAWNNKGIDEGMLGMYDQALASFQNAVAINQSYAEAWYNMGVIYDFKGNAYAAVQAYKVATQINPKYQKAWVRRNVNTDEIMGPSLSCACKDPIALV